MSDYSKSTNFTTKDTLPTGNAGKIVKGTELDTEFTAISSAIASKADTSSPALLGTPTSPTATSGSNTTQIANTAFVKAAVDALGTIGTMAAQNKTAVDITGGTIVGITDLTVADGGTGRSTLTDKAVLIGAGTGGITSVSPSTIGNVLTSDGTNWTSAAPAVGVGKSGTAWNNVSSSRSIGTSYTNSNSYPIQVNAGITAGGINTTTTATLTVGGVTVASNKVTVGNNIGSDCICSVSAIIPPSASYTLTGSGTLSYWAELY
jgi:hypothetical protein